MAPLYDPVSEKLARLLAGFNAKQTISSCAALLTFPEFQAATLRIDYLVHLATLYCHGKRKPTDADLDRWLNRNLVESYAWRLEDPSEDAFITTIGTRYGSLRIFQGVFANNDHHLQIMLGAAEQLTQQASAVNASIQSVQALLRLSDALCERLGLDRVSYAPSQPRGQLQIAPSTRIRERAKQLSFGRADLISLGISRELLEPFVFGVEGLQVLSQASDIGSSPLRFRPLLAFGDELVLALPHAVAAAARFALASAAEEHGLGVALNERLVAMQTAELQAALAPLGDIKACPLGREDLPPLASFQFEYERGHQIHLVLVPDDVIAAAKAGEFAKTEYAVRDREGVYAGLTNAQECIGRLPGIDRVTSMYVFGGIGRQHFLHVPPNRLGRRSVGLGLPDLINCLCTDLVEFRRLMKYVDQEHWARSNGVEFLNPSGAFGAYCHWVVSRFKVVPRSVPVRPNEKLPLLGDFMALVRIARRGLRDMHMAELEEGGYLDVVRFAQKVRIARYEKLPLYVSPTASKYGLHAGVVESSRGGRWLLARRTGKAGEAGVPSDDIWLNFLPFFAELVLELDERAWLPAGVLRVYLDLAEVREAETVGTIIDEGTAFDAIVIPQQAGTAKIAIPADFFLGFVAADNRAEKAFLVKLGSALLVAAGGEVPTRAQDELGAICDKILPAGSARLLHVLSGQEPLDAILNGKDEEPILVDIADMQFARIGIGLSKAHGKKQVLTGAAECGQFLNGVVDETWQRVKRTLNHLQRDTIIEVGLRSLEAIFADRLQWRNTALSHVNLFGERDAVKLAFDRQLDRVQASLATRVLLEIAICECPKAGLAVTRSEFEALLAQVALMIEMAYGSAAIYGGLAKPEVVIYPNGECKVDRETTAAIMMPFASNDFAAQYQDAAKKYESYLMPNSSDRALPEYPEDFVAAFGSEFGLTPIDFIKCYAELVQVGVEAGTVVVRSTVGAIRARFAQRRAVNVEVVERFLDAFCLVSRPHWDKVPKPFRAQDTWPWRFRRRLSLLVRPVLADGLHDADCLHYGLAQLVQSYYELLTRCEMGRFPQEFFLSAEMRAYAGRAANRYGLALENEVADILRQEGWSARTRVEMTELGGGAEQGDVDVLAWRSDGRVLALECKWLQSAKTVGEVAEVLKKFAGDEKDKDKLARHLARVDWLKHNTRELRRVTQLGPEALLRLDALLVTDKDVPMMYAENLPIPSKDVVPKRRLAEVVAR